MKRTRAQAFEIVPVGQVSHPHTLPGLIDDMILEIFDHTEIADARNMACTCRSIYRVFLERLKSCRFFFFSAKSVFSNGRTITSNNMTYDFGIHIPTLAFLQRILKESYQDPGANVIILSMMEIDQTSKDMRSFYVESPIMPPLLPIEVARALAYERKQAEFMAMLKEAVNNGTLARLLEEK